MFGPFIALGLKAVQEGCRPISELDSMPHYFDRQETTMSNGPAKVFAAIEEMGNKMYGTNSESIASFRFRLREAAKSALILGDALLQMSQDASEPTTTQLKELRDMENSLDVNVRLRLDNIRPKVSA